MAPHQCVCQSSESAQFGGACVKQRHVRLLQLLLGEISPLGESGYKRAGLFTAHVDIMGVYASVNILLTVLNLSNGVAKGGRVSMLRA